MIVIIAHHYVVNSGLMELIETDPMSTKSLFLLIFGWGGKYGINCFVMITGYFMCTSNISLKKFLKLFLEVEIYRVVIYLIFLTTGYEGFSLKSLLKQILPIAHIGSGFVDSYLVFFLLIPFLNILIKGMTEKQHISLVMICVMVFSVLPSVSISVQIGYVGWFSIIYFIASYIRLYSKKIFENRTFWGMCTVCLILLSWLSVMACAWMNSKGMKISFFYFVNDCNKVLAVTTAVATFLFFKNLHLRYSKIINQMAAATFGVLLIHANSDHETVAVERYSK